MYEETSMQRTLNQDLASRANRLPRNREVTLLQVERAAIAFLDWALSDGN